MNKHRQMTLFMHIVECGSISKAAEKLELSKSVLSHALKQLESELNTTLLKRTTRKQSLTPQGEAFYRRCQAMNEIVDQAWEDIRESQHEPSGSITITAPHALMESVIAPALGESFQQYPKVSLNLIADDHQLDLMQHDIDLAIRVGESNDSNYRQQKIGAFRDVLCCAKGNTPDLNNCAYIANHWQPKQIVHRLTYPSSQQSLEYRFTTKHRVNTINQVATMISLNMGVGIVPEFLLSNYPSLKPCVPNWQLSATNVYALHPYSNKPPLTVTMAREAICAKLKQCGLG